MLKQRNLYGLVGLPIAHSLSPKLFATSVLAQQGATYQLFPIKQIEDLLAICQKYRPQGLNVTSPYKSSVLNALPHLWLSPEVRALGATNVLKLDYPTDNNGNTLIHAKAYNTDVFGFIGSLRPLLSGHERLAIIIGTGGAARAAHYGLTTLGIESHFISRNGGDESLARYTKANASIVHTYDQVHSLVPYADLVIQATPLGRINPSAPNIPYHLLRPNVLGYDLNYGLGHSAFMEAIEQAGGRVLDGEAMLRLQAEESYRIWSL